MQLCIAVRFGRSKLSIFYFFRDDPNHATTTRMRLYNKHLTSCSLHHNAAETDGGDVDIINEETVTLGNL